MLQGFTRSISPHVRGRCGQLLCVGAALLSTVMLARAATAPPAPQTRTDPVVDTIQGVRIPDPYRWLEKRDDPAVQAWTNRQSERTRAYLDGLPTHAALKSRVGALMKAASPAFLALQARGSHVFALYTDPKFQQPMLVALDAAADPASRRTVVDPNVLDPHGLLAIDWFVASGDGSKVAVSLSKGGSEDGTLHVFALTGEEIDQPIPRIQYPTAGGSLAWAADNRGFWYTRYPGPEAPAAEQHFNMQAYFHVLGTPSASDQLALGSQDGLERVSEVFLDNRLGLPAITAMVQQGDGNRWAFYVLRAGAKPLRLATYEDQIVYATMGPDGAMYGISRRHSPKGEILKLSAPFKAGALTDAAVIVPASDTAIVSGGAEQGSPDLSFDHDRLFVRDIIGGPNQIRVFDLRGRPAGALPLPPVAGNSEIAPLASGDVLYDVTTFVRPRYYAVWHTDGRSGESALKQTSPISLADVEVVREFAVSKDGTRVPITILHRKGTALDHSNPTLLYGYGGYGISLTPVFGGDVGATMTRLWLDAGGMYTEANIRGGAEYGEAWHQQGMLTRKQNVFDDFYAAARHLIDHGYTSSAHLALMGGSNGGLLMGAEITQHPTVARAVISIAGIYDMVRTELDPNGSFNTTEYGSVKDADQFKALYAYSPYHHVTANTPYPAVLFLSGANDGRVNPMQSRKITAALQAATSSGRPILLRTDMNSGHGFGTSLDERISERADMLSFLFDQLNMKPEHVD